MRKRYTFVLKNNKVKVKKKYIYDVQYKELSLFIGQYHNIEETHSEFNRHKIIP